MHGDPRYILPIIFYALEERLEEKPKSVSELFQEIAEYGGVAAQAAHGMETFRRIMSDKNCTVIGTFSGIMTVAKMGGLMAKMADNGWLKAVFTTGALAGHGFVEGAGLKHYKYNPKFSDLMLAEQKLNRITDCLEPEENLDQVEDILSDILDKEVSGKKPVSPTEINYLIGKHLAKNYPHGTSIFRSAYEKNIPIFIPAFVDSELGNDLLINNRKRAKDGRPKIMVDCEIDSEKLVEIATGAKRLGIFSIGGGVPRNNAQNVVPLIEIMNVRLGLDLPENKYFYGCRICPDLPFWGHLSGCTYSEGASWRKTDIEHGRFSEVLADATMVFPFYMAAMREIAEGK
ncbi:MAG: hypothetical protein A3J76_05295 [Candidatus Moranbacteria bacterium RBG_13_45_13]|nr:MAG: hypothetical protein A3J76_05295 [Candidatus Moranbacteria bacterium RBG_13_45_13]